MVLIWSPSCSEVPASATTISPTSRPSRISVEVSEDSPTLTLRVSTVLPFTTCTVRRSIAVWGTATPQLRLASILARANMPTLSEGLLVSAMRTLPSWLVRSICGETKRTRPTRSGAPSADTRRGAGVELEQMNARNLGIELDLIVDRDADHGAGLR